MSISDELFVQLSLHCRGLTSLNIKYCEGGPLTGPCVLAVVERCTGLTFLRIRLNIIESFLPALDPAKLGQLYPHIEFDITPY